MNISKYAVILTIALLGCDGVPSKAQDPKIVALEREGWNGVLIGKDIKDYSQLKKIKESYVDGENCYYVSPTGEWKEDDPDIKVVSNIIVAIESSLEQTIDYNEIRVGDHEDMIYKISKNKIIQKISNDDVDILNQYFIILWDSEKKDKGVKYNIVDKVIKEISVGNEEVVYSGCT